MLSRNFQIAPVLFQAAGTSYGDDTGTVADVRGLEEMLGEVGSIAGSVPRDGAGTVADLRGLEEVGSTAESVRREPQTPRGVTPGNTKLKSHQLVNLYQKFSKWVCRS